MKEITNIAVERTASNMIRFSFLFLGILLFVSDSFGQAPVASNQMTPFVRDLKGISIGMSAGEVKEKLGKPKVSDKAGMYFEFAKGESGQIGLDAKKAVRTVALIFTDKSSNTPSFADIFGPDIPSPEKKDGSIYKLIRYTDAGFWIAYSRSAGKKPLTTITMRKIIK